MCVAKVFHKAAHTAAAYQTVARVKIYNNSLRGQADLFPVVVLADCKESQSQEYKQLQLVL